MKFVYLFYIIDDSFFVKYKIGVATDVDKRLKQLQTGNPYQIEMKYSFQTKFPFSIEKYYHNILKTKHVYGEWYELEDDMVFNFLEKCKELETNFEYLKENSTINLNFK